MATITILTENLVRKTGLLAEHGLSLWIENDRDHILFDTGQTHVFLHNAKALGIDVTQANVIIISHGHYDHGGGLAFFPSEARWPRVVFHPDAFLPKYTRAKKQDQPHTASGMPWRRSDLHQLEHHLLLNTSTVQIGENAVVFADIPHTVDFETISEDLLIEKNELLVQDHMKDEQLLVLSRPQGLVVIVGCSHPGIVNALKYVQLFYADQPIHTIIGGMHLERASPDRLRKTIDAFRKMDIRQIVPVHCTGQEVIWIMKRELGDRVLIRCTGETVEI